MTVCWELASHPMGRLRAALRIAPVTGKLVPPPRRHATSEVHRFGEALAAQQAHCRNAPVPRETNGNDGALGVETKAVEPTAQLGDGDMDRSGNAALPPLQSRAHIQELRRRRPIQPRVQFHSLDLGNPPEGHPPQCLTQPAQER
jgi:hypothetical protein